jgi:hypothetical protein
MKKILAIFILAICFISCNTNEETKINNSDLVGTWNWTGTDGGIAYHINDTPASTGKNIQFYLMKNYTYSITENENEISKGTYELTLKKSIYSGEMEPFIQCSENKSVQNVVINGIITVYDTNKLDISDNNYDGIGSGFEKIK